MRGVGEEGEGEEGGRWGRGGGEVGGGEGEEGEVGESRGGVGVLSTTLQAQYETWNFVNIICHTVFSKIRYRLIINGRGICSSTTPLYCSFTSSRG